MKKFILLSLGVMLFLGYAAAQTGFTLPEGKEVAVYSLPQTELCIEIEMEKTVQTPGTFYLYSERYLATQDVITEEKTNFALKNVSVKANAVPDLARTYTIPYGKNTGYNSLSVDEKGLLCGLNASSCCKESCCKDKKEKDAKLKNIQGIKKNAETKEDNLLPLTEEYMLAGSTSKMAEGAAKTIYRIRENRLSLITGDVDQLPDGEGLKEMLNEMNSMEKELTELFTGKTKTETVKYTIRLTPDSEMRDHVLFRFSTVRGVVPANDLSGYPYYMNIVPETIPVEANTSKKSPKQSNLFHILPAKTLVSIGDGKNMLFVEDIYMPQFGQEIPFPCELIQKKGIEIIIDSQTGKLLNIKEHKE